MSFALNLSSNFCHLWNISQVFIDPKKKNKRKENDHVCCPKKKEEKYFLYFTKKKNIIVFRNVEVLTKNSLSMRCKFYNAIFVCCASFRLVLRSEGHLFSKKHIWSLIMHNQLECHELMGRKEKKNLKESWFA